MKIFDALDDLIVRIARCVIRCIFSVARGLVYVQFAGLALAGLAALSVAGLALLVVLKYVTVGV